MELPEQARQISISRLRLPPRVQNALSRARIYKIDELLSSLETGLDNVNGIGQTAFNTIIGALTALASVVSIDGNIDWTAYWIERDLEPEEEVEQNTRTMSIDFPDNVKHLSISANILAIEDLLIATNNGLSKIQGLGSSSIDVINSALAVLVDTIGSDGQPNWYQYWQQRKIVIIPRNFKQEISSEQIITGVLQICASARGVVG
jgi:DNA-directed RNA polymerase alpha subunit